MSKAFKKLISFITIVTLVAPTTVFGIIILPADVKIEMSDISVTSTLPDYIISKTSIDENNSYVSLVAASSTGGAATSTNNIILQGVDASLFQIVASTTVGVGYLEFISAPDFENPTDIFASSTNPATNNVYYVELLLVDGGSIAGINLEVTVNNVSEIGAYIETKGSTSSPIDIQIAENATGTVATSSIWDTEGDSIVSVEFIGDDEIFFDFTYAASGTKATSTITLNSGLDFENPQDLNSNNIYKTKIKVTDSAGNVNSQTIKFEITDEVGEPIITSSKKTSVNENTGTTHLLTLTAFDDANQDITFSIDPFSVDASFFSINQILVATTATSTMYSTSSAELVFSVAPDFENPQDNNTNNVYKITVIATDSDGKMDTKVVKVTVKNVNEHSPEFTQLGGAATATVTMLDDTKVVTTLYSTDQDSNSVYALSIIGGADAALFKIKASNDRLKFKNTAATGTYVVIVEVSDGLRTDTQEITVNVLDSTINYAPETTNYGGAASGTETIIENSTDVIVVIQATDLNYDNLEYTIDASSTDAAFFDIDIDSGELTLGVGPDFENPLDSDKDNVYSVVVIVSDESDQGSGYATGTVTINVTILDEDESPELESSTSTSFAENATGTIFALSWSDPQGQDLVLAMATGSDSAYFSFATTSTSTAVLSTLSSTTSFDYESPVDSNTDNVYEVVLTATDPNGHVSTSTVYVSITGVNEFAPSITYNSGTASTSHSVQEGVVVVETITATDTDGDSLEWSLDASSTDVASFSIATSTGEISFAVTTVYVSPVDANTDNVYEVTVIVSDGTSTTSQEQYVTVTQKPVVITTTSSGGGGGTRYACRDEEALNYSSYGKHDEDKCKYEENEENNEEKDSTQTEEDENTNTGEEVGNSGTDDTGNTSGTNTFNNTGGTEPTTFDFTADGEGFATPTEDEKVATLATSTEEGGISTSQAASLLGAISDQEDNNGSGLWLLIVLVGSVLLAWFMRGGDPFGLLGAGIILTGVLLYLAARWWFLEDALVWWLPLLLVSPFAWMMFTDYIRRGNA